MNTIPLVGISVWLIVKAFFIIGLLVYLVFAFVVWRQVNIMTDTLDLGFEKSIKALAILHLIFAILILIFSFALPV